MVFASTGTNLYHPVIVNEALLKLDPSVEPYFSESRPSASTHLEYARINPDLDWDRVGTYSWLPEVTRLRKLYSEGQLERLENPDCLKSYAVQYQTKGSLLLVANNQTLDRNFCAGLGGPWGKQNWICSDSSCDNSYNSSTTTRDTWLHPDTWQVADISIAYCLAEVPPERCKLQLSLPLAIIVIFFNSVKAICMVTMLIGRDKRMDDSPIMNIGDAVASFLDRPDATTKNMGLATWDDFR